MKTIVNLIFISVAIFLTSCATTVKFPISDVWFPIYDLWFEARVPRHAICDQLFIHQSTIRQLTIHNELALKLYTTRILRWSLLFASFSFSLPFAQPSVNLEPHFQRIARLHISALSPSISVHGQWALLTNGLRWNLRSESSKSSDSPMPISCPWRSIPGSWVHHRPTSAVE